MKEKMTKEHDDFRKTINDIKTKEEEERAIAVAKWKKECEEAKKSRELANAKAKIKEEENKTILKKYDDLLKPFLEIVRDEYVNTNDAVIKSEFKKLSSDRKPEFFDRSYSHSPEVERFEHDNDCFDGKKYKVYIYSPLSYHIEMKWDYNHGFDPQGSDGHVVFPHYEREISITIYIDYIDPISKKLVKNDNLIANASECSGIITLLHKKKPLFINQTTYYYRKERADWKVKVSLNDPDWQEKITDEILRQLSE